MKNGLLKKWEQEIIGRTKAKGPYRSFLLRKAVDPNRLQHTNSNGNLQCVKAKAHTLDFQNFLAGVLISRLASQLLAPRYPNPWAFQIRNDKASSAIANRMTIDPQY
jgi:hypothetical protein